MTGWRQCKLGDTINLKRGYDLPQSQRQPGPYAIVSSSGITDHHAIAKVKGPGVVTGRYGTLGQVFYVQQDFWPLNTSLYVQDFKGNDPRFISYFLRQLDFGTRNSAGAVPGVNRNHLHAMDVWLPPHPVQRRIAGILSAYDELMENCQRRIRILEEMARALYREWFVQFRFPGHEKIPRFDSLLGSIPQGWEVTDLAEVCVEKIGVQTGPFGSQLHEADYSDEGVPVVMPKDLIGFRIRTDSIARIPEATAEKLSRHRMKLGDIVYGRRGDIGRRAYLMPHQIGWFCGTGCLRVRPNPARVNGWYLFNYLGQEDVVSLIAGRAQGVTMPNLNTGLLASIPVALPPRETQDRFAALTFPMAQGREALVAKTENLRRTRDLLLPRLLSGQVALDVSAVEDVAEPTAPAPPLSQTDPASEEPALRAAEEAPPDRVERAGHGLPPPAEPADEAPVPIDQIDRTAVLQVIRQVFSEGPPRERDAAIRDVARALGYRRTGARIREILHTDLLTAVRRGILENTGGALRLLARSITDYERDFLKAQFLAAIGRPWNDRDTATRDFCRWLGFARTGPVIEDTARSLIKSLLREGRLEADGAELIRRV